MLGRRPISDLLNSAEFRCSEEKRKLCLFIVGGDLLHMLLCVQVHCFYLFFVNFCRFFLFLPVFVHSLWIYDSNQGHLEE